MPAGELEGVISSLIVIEKEGFIDDVSAPSCWGLLYLVRTCFGVAMPDLCLSTQCYGRMYVGRKSYR